MWLQKSDKRFRKCYRILFCRFLRGEQPTPDIKIKEVNDLKRKLFALLLSGLAIVLLMGAGLDPMVQAVQAANSAQEELVAPAQEPASQIEEVSQPEQEA